MQWIVKKPPPPATDVLLELRATPPHPDLPCDLVARCALSRDSAIKLRDALDQAVNSQRIVVASQLPEGRS